MTFAESKALRLYLTLAAIVLLLVFNGWFLNWNFQKVAEQEYLVSHTSKVLDELDEALSLCKDLETGARGFMVTGDPTFLDPFHSGVTRAPVHIEEVRNLTIDNPERVTAANALEALFKRFVENNQAMIDSRTAKNFDVNRVKHLMAEGKSIMDEIRGQVVRMKDAESRLLIVRSAEAEKSKVLFTWALLTTTLLGIGVIILAFRQFRANQVRTEKEAAEKRLESRIQESVGEITRSVSGDISAEKAAADVQAVMARKLPILAARMFIFERGFLTQIASFGTDDTVRGKDRKSRDLVDEALMKNELWQIKEVPQDYWKIKSSMGESRPQILAFLPLSFQGRRIGVIELGLFSELIPEQIELLNRSAANIGIGLNAAQSRVHLQKLLEETQQQAEELQAQQEELRTNNEELEQQARALESQQQSLNTKNRELEITQADLEEKAADLERSSHYKSEFLAKMSHELRTPLNGLLILSTLLMENKQNNLTDQQLRFANSIHSAGNDLLLLINDILDLSKIEARKLALRAEEFSLGALFEQKFQVFSPQATAKGIEFNVDLDEAARNHVLFTDQQRLEQILRNFLSNAMKFTEKGSVTMIGRIAGDQVEISVRDTGVGIPKEKQGLVFEAFEQADSSVSRKFGGTGLGLTISRELAHLLGGEIMLESVEGTGSVFTLRLPSTLPDRENLEVIKVGRPSAPKNGHSKKNGTKPAAADLAADTLLRDVAKHPKTILIVEDDESFLQGVCEAVKAYGFEPIAAHDGEVALAILEKHLPSAILLDIKLPGISGLGILEMIKHKPHLRHIPVHMISAMNFQSNALRMGALGYLTKPVTMDKVRSALGRIENLISQNVRRILLVEDDQRQSEAISELVAGKDVKVTSARSGEEAIAQLEESSFDCIILDLTLPDISGFDLLTKLNKMEISLPPIVIYTAKDLSREEEEYLRSFSESIIIKGARSPERLLDDVNLFLHRVESLLPENKRAMIESLRSQGKTFDGKTVLVVDDDMRNVFALTSALEGKNLTVRIARDGQEALDMLAKHKDIDIVLMDIMMPKMDGLEATRRIRESYDPQLKGIPVIALTAKAMREDHEKCIAAGCSDYLPKPVNLENLLTALKVWLAPRDIFT